MKRALSGEAMDVLHPSLCFHREVLLVQQWSTIRNAFVAALERAAAPSEDAAGRRVPPKLKWLEPHKLWRHAHEALGKWLLSQLARATSSSSSSSNNTNNNFSWAKLRDDDAMRVFFIHLKEAEGGATPTSYDEQLIRDLSMKSNGTNTPEVVEIIAQVVKSFQLTRRCLDMQRWVARRMSTITPRNALQPHVRRVEEEDDARTAHQARIAGPIAEFSVQWPTHWPRGETQNCPPVSIPWAAYLKLRQSYARFGRDDDAKRYGAHMDDEARLLRRAAVVALRYEGGLSTGSLQLCADTGLKQHLHAAGYLVMDLCASPINAYMGLPASGSFHPTTHDDDDDDDGATTNNNNNAPTSSLDGEQERPNFFCSAFLDTDWFFGSLGSALRVDVEALWHAHDINPNQQPLLLTLDVPYDEDLCELLFQKLVKDMVHVEQRGEAHTSSQVDYVLVLPLWWRIPMARCKTIFATQGSAEAQDDASALMAERSAALQQGYQVRYTWPEDLAHAAGGAEDGWGCFDGIFVGGQYGYFCTATNKWLHDVTATEVIGIEQPAQYSMAKVGGEGSSGGVAHQPRLRDALRSYYGRL